MDADIFGEILGIIMLQCGIPTAWCLGHVNKVAVKTYKKYINFIQKFHSDHFGTELRVDMLLYCIFYKDVKLVSYFAKLGYSVSQQAVDKAILIGRLDILHILENTWTPIVYDQNSVELAVRSNNVNMLMHVIKDFQSVVMTFEMQHNMMKYDNAKMWGAFDSKFCNMMPNTSDLVKYNSVNIIEGYRKASKNKTEFERIIKMRAEEQQNVIMIEYCNDHRYGKI